MRTFRRASVALLVVACFSMYQRADATAVQLVTPRASHAVVHLADGRLLLTGGANADGLIGTIEVFDPATRVSQTVGTLATARKSHTAVTLQDGRVLIAGGEGSNGVLSDAELFDPTTGAVVVMSMSGPRSAHTATLLRNGTVLLAGGSNGMEALPSLELFDPATRGFSSLAAALSSPRERHSATLIDDGRVLIIGGRNPDGVQASTEYFDAVTATTSPGPSLSVARYGHTATRVVHGDVAIVGGTDGTNALGTGEFYCFADRVFYAMANELQTARYDHSAIALPDNGNVLLIGGQSDTGAVAGIETLHPLEFSFESGSSLESARTRLGLGLGNDSVWALGGSSSNLPEHAQGSAEPVAFARLTTDLLDYPPDALVTFDGSGWLPGERVDITIRQSDGDPDTMLSSTADDDGTIHNTDFSTAANDGGVTFVATARGATSGRTALREFYDNHSVSSISPSSFLRTTSQVSMSISGSGFNSASFVEVLFGGTFFAQIVNRTDTQLNVIVPSAVTNSPGGWSVQVRLITQFSFCHFHSIFFQCHVHTGTETHSVSAPNLTVLTDTTPPNITPTIQGPLGLNGWYRGDVFVFWSVNDPQSGITFTSGCGTSSITFDTNGTNITCSAGSAGGSTSSTVTIRRDTTPPSIFGNRFPFPNASGWNNSDVTVSFTCSDSGSNLAGSGIAPTTLTLEGAGQMVTRSCSDHAGNVVSQTVGGINIDKTAPQASAVPDRVADQNGWYNHGLTVNWSGTDVLSGIAQCSTATNYSGPDTTGGNVSGACTDRAGNGTQASFGFKFDATAPVLTIAAPLNGAVYVLNGPAVAAFTCSDALSGLVSCVGSVPNGGVLPTGQVGPHGFSVAATDVAGNASAGLPTYSVQYAAQAMCGSGPGRIVLSPVNEDGSSVFKQGRTVPAKFRVCDANGVSIGPASVVTDFRLVQVLNGTESEVNESVPSTTPDANFRWDSTDQHWIFNMATSSVSANRTYVYRISLNDGSSITFRFGLR